MSVWSASMELQLGDAPHSSTIMQERFLCTKQGHDDGIFDSEADLDGGDDPAISCDHGGTAGSRRAYAERDKRTHVPRRYGFERSPSGLW